MKFDTKIAIALKDDLPAWQKLNMTAFMASGIATEAPGLVGEAYEDGSGRRYLPMFRQPVLVFAGTAEALRGAYERAVAAGLAFALFTEDLFRTGHDEANRAAVKAVASPDLRLVGLALRAERKLVDKVMKGLSLHG
jgi:hypothetical protein